MKCLTTLKLRFLLRKEHHLHISQLVDCERISKTGLTLTSKETPTIKKKKGHKILGNPKEKWAKSMKRKLIEEETLMANKYMKRYSTSLVITEKQIEPTMIYHFTPIRSAKITKLDNIKGRSVNEATIPSSNLSVLSAINSSSAQQFPLPGYLPQRNSPTKP